MGDPITCPLGWRVCSPNEPCYLCMKAQRDSAISKIRAFEEAKDHEAVLDLLGVLGPFYLHARALRDAGRLEDTREAISKQGASSLVAGGFVLAIETFEKWGKIMEVLSTEESDHVQNP